jgi:hypothetical protein
LRPDDIVPFERHLPVPADLGIMRADMKPKFRPEYRSIHVANEPAERAPVTRGLLPRNP